MEVVFFFGGGGERFSCVIDGKNEGKVMDGVREQTKGGLNSDLDASVRHQEGAEDSRWWLQTDRLTG